MLIEKKDMKQSTYQDRNTWKNSKILEIFCKLKRKAGDKTKCFIQVSTFEHITWLCVGKIRLCWTLHNEDFSYTLSQQKPGK